MGQAASLSRGIALGLLLAAPASAQQTPPAQETPAAAETPPAADDDWGETDDAPADDGWGAEPGWGDAGFEGMDDIETAPPPPPRDASLTGFVRYDLGLWATRTDSRAFAKDRLNLDLAFRYRSDRWRIVAELHGEYDAAYLADRDRFDQPTLDVYEARVLSGEQYIALSLDDVEITIGRQIVPWNRVDLLSVLDVTGPRDLREPGLADIEDLRLGVLATRIGWFIGDHRVEAMAVHEAYFDERPPPLGEFSPLRAFVLSNETAATLLGERTVDWHHRQSRFDPAATQGFLRWTHTSPTLDSGLYAAWALDQQGVVELPEGLIATIVQPDAPIDLELDHDRYWLLGYAGGRTLDAWIIEWELAATLGKAYNTGDPDAGLTPDAIGRDDGDLIAGAVGVSWSGIAETTIGLELAGGRFVERPDDLLFPADAPRLSLRVVHQAMRQKLRLLATASAFGATAEHGWLMRAEATYSVADGAAITAGYVHFGQGDDGEFGPFYGLDEHDRAFLRVRWDFDLY